MLAKLAIAIDQSVRVEDFVVTESGVEAVARDIDTGRTFKISSRFLAGCDGGRSLVRHKIGAMFEGDAIIQRVQSTYIRAPELIHLQRHERAWATFSLNPRRLGVNRHPTLTPDFGVGCVIFAVFFNGMPVTSRRGLCRSVVKQYVGSVARADVQSTA